MNLETIDISKFRRDNTFYDPLKLILTIKSFDLQAIRKRYIQSKKNLSGRAGSVERREAGVGGIAVVTIENDRIADSSILARLREPRGVDCKPDERDGPLIGIAAESIVYLISDDKISEISDPWFSYIHTLSFSPADPDLVLIASSGFDSIFEYNTKSLKKTFEWFAWENGFNKAKNPATGNDIFLTRKEDEARRLEGEGKEFKLIDHPKDQQLPTALRAAFINSVDYDRATENGILATYFHEGAVYQINKASMAASVVLDDLERPHGGVNFEKGFLATSTAGGEVVIGNMEDQKRFLFSKLPGKPGYLKELEWLQNSIVHEANIITIDSNRTSFIIFNPEQECYSVIPYDDNWAIQDLKVGDVSEGQEELLKRISIGE